MICSRRFAARGVISSTILLPSSSAWGLNTACVACRLAAAENARSLLDGNRDTGDVESWLEVRVVDLTGYGACIVDRMLAEGREVLAVVVKCLTPAVAGARTSNMEFAEEDRRPESCTNNLAAERAGSRHLEEDIVEAVVGVGCGDDGPVVPQCAPEL